MKFSRLIMSVLALFAVILLLCLGFWQLERAHEKEYLLQAYAKRAASMPMSVSLETSLPQQYQNIRLYGHFLKPVLLLDNQYYHHRWGYDVLGVFELSSKQAVIVDLGWQQGDQTRLTFPQINLQYQMRTLSGYAYYPSPKYWVLGKIFEEKSANLSLVERVDIKILEKFLHKSLYPFIIRLAPQETGGYIRDWPIVAMPPARHYGYAVQWFMMAGVLVISYMLSLLHHYYERK